MSFTKIAASGGGSGGTATLAIGATVTSGSDNAILFIDPAATLAQDSGLFEYDKANIRMAIGGAASGATAKLQITNTTGSDSSFRIVSDRDAVPVGIITSTGDPQVLAISGSNITNNGVGMAFLSMTTGNGLQVVADAVTSGSVASLQSASTAATGNLLSVLGTGASTAGTVAEFQQAGSLRNVFLNTDGDAITMQVDSEAITANTFEINTDLMTTGTGMNWSANDLTTGGFLSLNSSSLSASTRNLVSISNTNASASGATPLFIDQNADAPAIDVDMDLSTPGSGASEGINLNYNRAIATSAGIDFASAMLITAARSSAVGGTIDTSGLAISISDDGGGDSTLTGVNISASGSPDNRYWLRLSDGTDVWGLFSNGGTPEGVIAADIGSIATDTTNGTLYVKTTDTLNTGWEAVGSDTDVESFTQTAHGITLANGYPVPVYRTTGGLWALAQANAVTTLHTAYVTAVPDANTLTIQQSGFATATGHGLTVGNFYSLDETTAGTVTLTGPENSASAFQVIDANTLQLFAQRPFREAGAISTIADTDGDTQVQVEETADEDIVRIDIGDAEGTALPNHVIIGGTTTGMVINENGADVDFRIEGDTQQNLFSLDASQEGIGVGIAAPSGRMQIVTNDTENIPALIVNQLDTTNNPTAINVTNSGTGDSLNISHGGATGQAIDITTLQTSDAAMIISGPNMLTGSGLSVSMNALTTGGLASFSSDSSNVSARNLVQVINDNTAAIGATPLRLQQDADANVLAMQRLSSGQFMEFTDSADIFGFYNSNGTPEGSVAANIGSRCTDTTNGLTYMKTSDSLNTGWRLDGGVVKQYEDVSAATTLDESHQVVGVDASGGALTITLGAIATFDQGREFTIKKNDSSTNIITVDADGAETIDGSTTFTLANQHDSVTVVRGSSEWEILSVVNNATPVALHKVSMRRAAAQALSVAADTDIVLDTTDYDTGGLANLGGGNVVIVQDGTYMLIARGSNVTASNNTQVYVNVDGVKQGRVVNAQAASGNIDGQCVVFTRELTAGQVITMGVYANGGNTSTTTADQPALEVIQLAETSSTLPNTLVAVDQSASNYFDVGGMRMQWGTTPSGTVGQETITLPASFANTSYSVTASSVFNSASNQATIHIMTQATGSFDAYSVFDNASPTGAIEGFNWIAIGLKP